jgi:cytochrome c oxidase subunit 4
MAEDHTVADRLTHEHVEDVGSHGEHHVVPTRVYHIVFFALMILLIVTLAAAAIDLGPLNVMIAVTIAVIKASLVVLYFMHVRYSTQLVQFFAGATFFWLAILFVLTLSDYFTRPLPVLPEVGASAVVSGQ